MRFIRSKKGRQKAGAVTVVSFVFLCFIVGWLLWGAYRVRRLGTAQDPAAESSQNSLRGPSVSWPGPSAANRAIFSASSAAHRDFCSAMPSPTMSAAEAAWVAGHGLDLVNRWPPDRLARLESSVKCHWAQHYDAILRLPPIPLCVHDPKDDTLISAAILRGGWWGGFEESAFMLGGGYAAGTPLNKANASAMRAAAAAATAAGSPNFESTQALVSALRLAPPDPQTPSACSRERPVVLDVGGNIGLFADAFAESGCTVVVVEPLTINAGRFWHTMRRNGWTDHVWLYKNAVGMDRRLLTLQYYTSIHGQSTVRCRMQAEPPNGTAPTPFLHPALFHARLLLAGVGPDESP
jgi:hypothetical protein